MDEEERKNEKKWKKGTIKKMKTGRMKKEWKKEKTNTNTRRTKKRKNMKERI